MMGSIVKRGRRYHIVYRLDGKQRWESAGTRKKDAERLLTDRLVSKAKGTLREFKTIGFSEFADQWLRDYAMITVKDSTLESYGSVIRTHLKPFFEGRELGSITVADCQALVAKKLREGSLSPKTVVHILVILKEMLECAVEWDYLGDNPARRVKRPRTMDKEMDFLTPGEFRLLLEHASSDYRTLFLTAGLTGMRRGELLGLKWEDVDFTHSTIHVRRALWKDKLVTPKSRRSARPIVMSPMLAEALRERRLAQDGGEKDFVFANGNGKPLDGQNVVHREFLPALRRAGLKRIRFHDLRHTYASLLISRGENVKFIQSQLGHASIQVTIDRYGHLMPEVGNGAGQRLDETVFGKSVSKALAKSPSEDFPRKEEALEPIEAQGLSMVAGAGYTHQKRNFPPVDVIDLQFEYQGKALVPVGA